MSTENNSLTFADNQQSDQIDLTQNSLNARTVNSAITLQEEATDDNVSPFDIFNNPQIKRAKESLPDDLRRQYEQMGESIWSQMETSQASISNNNGENINFTGDNLPPPVEEAAAHIAEAIKSGMHPSLLEEDEQNLMKECFGKTWWRHWNYTDEEMDQGIA